MAHAHGAHIGGIATIDDLMGRCRVDQATDCWHLRTARGRPMERGKTMRIWSHLHGRVMSARQLALAMGTARPVPQGYVVVCKCDSYDCVNPEHLRALTRADEIAQKKPLGTYKTARKTLANRATGRKRQVHSDELRRWMHESTQPATHVAHAIGCATSRVIELRRMAIAGLTCGLVR